MISTLREILAAYPTDKDTDHSYGPVYERLLEPIRQSARIVIELGVLWGGSLRAWRDYFPNATVYGIDVNEEYLFSEDRIICLQGNQDHPATIVDALTRNIRRGSVDLVIDDGQHDHYRQMNCLFALWDFLRPGGYYAIEDSEEGLGRFSVLPYVQEFDLRNRKGRSDDVLFIFTKP